MKTILITGCSRGIGFEFVKVALNHNHNVIAISRNTSSLNTIEDKNLHIYKGDISNLNDVLVIKNDLINKSIKLDSIINNAGYLVNKPFLEISQEEIYEMINVNFVAPVNIVKTFIDLVFSDGHILNIGSMGGYQGSVKFPGLSIYSSTKGALAVLTECLAEEFKETSVNFNCLCLGSVQTEMLEEAFPGYQAPISPKEMANYFLNFISQKPSVYKGKVIPVSVNTP